MTPLSLLETLGTQLTCGRDSDGLNATHCGLLSLVTAGTLALGALVGGVVCLRRWARRRAARVAARRAARKEARRQRADERKAKKEREAEAKRQREEERQAAKLSAAEAKAAEAAARAEAEAEARAIATAKAEAEAAAEAAQREAEVRGTWGGWGGACVCRPWHARVRPYTRAPRMGEGAPLPSQSHDKSCVCLPCDGRTCTCTRTGTTMHMHMHIPHDT